MPGFIMGGGAVPPYLIPNSIRTLRYTNGGYLTRTPASSGNQQKWTVATWVKPARENNFYNAGSNNYPINVLNAGSVICAIVYQGDESQYYAGGAPGSRGNTFDFYYYNGGAVFGAMDNSENWADNSAHTHLIVAYDTTQATPSNRLRMWLNGVERTPLSTFYGWPALNSTCPINQGGVTHYIGNSAYTGDYLGEHDAIFSDYMFLDSQYITDPLQFGRFDGAGVWTPKRFQGSFTGNSYYLKFQNPGNLGYDSSGLGNHWTAVTLTSTDCLTDTPTNNTCTYARDYPGTAGGMITYCGLKTSNIGVGTMNALVMNSYWEISAQSAGLAGGVISQLGTASTISLTSGLIYGFRLSTAGLLEYTVTGSSWTTVASGLTGVQFPYCVGGTSTANFGQTALNYSVPTNYSLLTTTNLPSASTALSGSFLGNASSDGPNIWMAGTPATMTVNGNAVTFGTHAARRATGVKIITASSAYNASGVNTWTATAGTPFKGSHANTAQGDI